jgi:uncharacterized protein RhaS with RHS repeats
MESITGERPELQGDGPNLYAYVRNQPVKLSDPLGLLAWGNWAPVVDPSVWSDPDFQDKANTFDKDASVAGVCMAGAVWGGVALGAVTAETAAGAAGGTFITNNLFRWGTKAAYKEGGKMVQKGLHCHVGPGKELMRHHLPYQARTWLNHAKAKLTRWWNGL